MRTYYKYYCVIHDSQPEKSFMFHFRFQNDYARQAFSYKIEKELLEPILRDIEKLKGEFLRIMGNPIGPDGQRRIVTVMVVNSVVILTYKWIR